jgi:hypothetical protein
MLEYYHHCPLMLSLLVVPVTLNIRSRQVILSQPFMNLLSQPVDLLRLSLPEIRLKVLPLLLLLPEIVNDLHRRQYIIQRSQLSLVINGNHAGPVYEQILQERPYVMLHELYQWVLVLLDDGEDLLDLCLRAASHGDFVLVGFQVFLVVCDQVDDVGTDLLVGCPLV